MTEQYKFVPRQTTDLEKDLHREAQKRLRKWAQDTQMRCEAVDITDDVTLSIILSVLTYELSYIGNTIGFDVVELMEHLRRAKEERPNELE